MDHPALHRQLQKSEGELLLLPLKRSTLLKEVRAETQQIVLLEKSKAVQIDFGAEISG